jgi:phosphatidylglycerophosphatase A
MTEKTDPASPAAQDPSEPMSSSASAAKPQKKPRFALFVATAGGLGYFPKAPGTFGSLAGVAIYALVQSFFLPLVTVAPSFGLATSAVWIAWTAIPIAIVLAIFGLWSAERTARFAGHKDPQFVVIDEVSGQHLTYLLSVTLLNWKYLLLGFILFRVFDIWKPFPARQAESLPGGWGIMTDDWVAGIYAALGLWLARAAGL